MNDIAPIVTTEISLYPLRQDVEPPVIAFVKALRAEPVNLDLAIGEVPDLD